MFFMLGYYPSSRSYEVEGRVLASEHGVPRGSQDNSGLLAVYWWDLIWAVPEVLFF